MAKDKKTEGKPSGRPEKKEQGGKINEGKGSQKSSQGTELRGTGPRKPEK